MSDISKAFITVLAILVAMVIGFIIVLYKDNEKKENIRNILIGLSFVIVPVLVVVIFCLIGFLKV